MAVEYNAKERYDGLCITILVSVAKIDGKTPQVANNDEFGWHTIKNSDLATKVTDRQHKCLQLIDTVRESGIALFCYFVQIKINRIPIFELILDK